MAKKAEPFKVATKVTAVIEIDEEVAFGTDNERNNSDAYNDISANLGSLEVKGDYLIGSGGCGNEAVVCHLKHLPALIEALKKAVALK